MEVLNVELDTLLEFRRGKNIELFMNDTGEGWGEFFVQADNGILMRARGETASAELSGAMPYVNKPIVWRDKRLTSYNWLADDEWPSPSAAQWTGAPDAGYKLLIHSIQVRFPKNIGITAENKLYFKVHLYIPPYGVIPVINLEYDSVRALAKKSNNPLVPTPYPIPQLTSEELVEMEFVYSDPYQPHHGSPIVLHSSRGEYLEIGLTGNTPLKNHQGQAYDSANETWCVVNGKQVYDF